MNNEVYGLFKYLLGYVTLIYMEVFGMIILDTILDALRYVVSLLSIVIYFIHYFEMRHRLNQYARKDMFTGLYNKIFFSHVIQKWLDRDDVFYLFTLDIDNFKSVNDTYGHIIGDNVILHLAHSLEKICPSGTMISRFGGDEFVFAQQNTSEEIFAPWLNQLQDLSYQTSDGISIQFTVSVGVCKSSGFTKYEELYRVADKCLYDSKKSGKGRYTLHSPNETKKSPSFGHEIISHHMFKNHKKLM